MRIHMMPANDGDAFLVEYGRGRRVLIDGGRPSSEPSVRARIEELSPDEPMPLELMVLTHIDSDHIGGLLKLLSGDTLPVAAKDFWFNIWSDPPLVMGGGEGVKLTALIHKLALPRNANPVFGGGAVGVLKDSDALPVVELAGDAKVTVLSPDDAQLTRLKDEWDKQSPELELARLFEEDGRGEPAVTLGKRLPPKAPINVAKHAFDSAQDKSEANGSSIAFIFEHGEKKVLFTGDAYPTVLVASAARLGAGPHPVDVFKVSHHGAAGNTSIALLETFPASTYLISTNAATHGHPHVEAIARIVSRPWAKTLVFNYDNAYTRVWDDPALKAMHNYEVIMPDDGESGVILDV